MDLLSYDPFTGIREYVDYDEATDGLILRTEQDCEGILDLNKDSQNDSSEGWRGEDNSMWRVASIPLVLIQKWLQEDGIDVFNQDHMPAVLRKLNDPEYRYLKCAPVRI